jgi:PAS domain S-box-containing protein
MKPDQVRILVVEDEAIVAEDLKLSLEDMGYVVVATAASGEDAVSLAGRMFVDLVLMDIVLAGPMDGITAAQLISSQFDLPVVYLTAFSDGASMERVKATQPYGYLTKPFVPHELHATIETAIYKHAMERRVRESEEKYRTLVALSPDGICVTVQGVIRLANAAMAHILGESVTDRLVNETLVDFFHPEDRQALQHALAFSGPVRQPHRFHEFRVQRPDASWLYVDLAASRVQFEGREGIQMVLRDVTERKRTQDHLAAQRDLSVALSATSNLQEALYLCIETTIRASGMDCAGIYLSGEDGSLTLKAHVGLSLPFVRAVEYQPEHSPNVLLVGLKKPVFSEHRDIVGSEQAISEQEGLKSVGILPILHEDRVIGCFNVGSHERERIEQPARDFLETIAAQVGSAIARIKAEQEARNSREQVELISEALPLGICYLDVHGIVRFTNRLCRLWLDRPPEVVGGLPEEDTEASSLPEQLREHFQAAVEGKEAAFQGTVTCRDGRCTPCLRIQFIPHAAHDGTVKGVFVLVRDLARQRQAEESLRESEERLKSTIASLHDLLLVIDGDGLFIGYYQPPDLEPISPAPEELLGRHYREVLPPQVAIRLDIAVQDILRTDAVQQFEFALPSGADVRTYSARVAARKSATGQYDGVTILARDITGQAGSLSWRT